ncbi:MAG TPA: putative selenium-dependent hydroxylase accessory protein YqeC [Desulfosporosinus sp.]|nr:putative selenium-dependent hydroxylase accessory protein YqeC [Desulfosporosinus sp.]
MTFVTSSNIGSAISGTLWDMTQRLRVTTFIGAGGKTTCLRSLTHEIRAAGQQVVATTTTKVFPEDSMIPWRNYDSPPHQKGAWFWYASVEGESGKWIGPSVIAVDEAILAQPLDEASLRNWVIEGDGARGLKLKCWEFYEPQIPRNTECAVLVVDRNLWGKVLQVEDIHRPHACRDLLGQVLKAESAWSYFLKSPVFDPQYANMCWVILLNSVNPVNPVYTAGLLNDLRDRWSEIQPSLVAAEKRPRHLRLAAGDAKEGDLLWFDLW